MKKVVIKTKTLSLSQLGSITGCIPPKFISCIQAEQVGAGVMDACLGMGIALRLHFPSGLSTAEDHKPVAKSHGRHVEPDELASILHAARSMGVTVMMAQSDLSGVRAVSREEAEAVIGNAAVRIRSTDDKLSDTADGAGQPACIGAQHIFSDAAQRLLDAGYLRGQTYEQCLEMAKWHPGMRDFLTSMGPDGSEVQKQHMGFALSAFGGGEAERVSLADEENRVFAQKARQLFAAGYLYEQTYEQCLEMAKWHSGMASYIQTELPGRIGSEEHRKAFDQARKYLMDMASDPAIDFWGECDLHHRAVWEKVTG